MFVDTDANAMGRVKVFVRVRPQNSIEAGKGGQVNSALLLDPKLGEVELLDATELTAGSQKRFTFDGVFAPDSQQEEVFEAIGRPTVDRVLAGYNGTVLAYGQTSSGKTHTMMGPGGGAAEALRSEQRGMTPRVLQHLMGTLGALPEAEVSWTVQLSVCELYNEELFDLGLGAGEEGVGELRIREDRTSGRGVYVENLKTVSVRTAEDALQAMMRAADRKHMGGTNANETSSRSHTIVQLLIEQVNNVDGGTKTSSQLFLVDLAGSERLSKAFSTAVRVKEAQNINLSLTLLGNVINKLTDGKALHVPYRDSKLTRLLQDSLGGNAMTTLLCACSPSTFNAAETLSTLMFANRAKKIENRPRANKILSDDELRKAYMRALDEIRNLEDTISTLRRLASGRGSRSTPTQQQTPLPSSAGAAVKAVPRPSSGTPSKFYTPITLEDANAAALEELRDAVRCLTLDLKDAREENHALDQRLNATVAKATFYQARDLEIRKRNSERDKQIAELTAQLTAALNQPPKPCATCAAAKASATAVTVKPVSTPPAGKPSATSFIRSAPKTPLAPVGAVPSKPLTPVASSSNSAVATQPAKPSTTPVTVAVVVGARKKQPTRDADTQTADAAVRSTAESKAPKNANDLPAEASQALLESIRKAPTDRESFLLSLLDMIKNDSGSLLKYKIIIERLNKELSYAEADSNRKLSKHSQVYESQMARMERRMRELQLKLAIAIQRGGVDDGRYLESMEDAAEGKSLTLLQMENHQLCEDKRAHMAQIVQLSSRVEVLQSELNKRALADAGFAVE